MGRASRFRIMLGAAIICGISMLTEVRWLSFAAFILVVLSCFRLKEKPATNYTELYGPPEPDDDPPSTPFNTKIDEQDLEIEDTNPPNN